MNLVMVAIRDSFIKCISYLSLARNKVVDTLLFIFRQQISVLLLT